MLSRLALSIVILFCGAFAYAQDESAKSANLQEKSEEARPQEAKEARSDRETREIFFRTLNECRSRGAQEFGFLLYQKSVREEIGLDDAGAKVAREVLSKSRSNADKLYEQLKHRKITEEELKAEFVKVMAEADRDMWKTLTDFNAKRDRLIGLYVQLHKSPAVLNKVVAEKIGLDELRRMEMVAKKEVLERRLIDEAAKENEGREDRMRSWEKIQKKVDSAIADMLSEEQRSKLEALKGDPFVFERFPFPPPGSPGRGREPGRDRDRRERDNNRDEKCHDNEKFADDR